MLKIIELQFFFLLYVVLIALAPSSIALSFEAERKMGGTTEALINQNDAGLVVGLLTVPAALPAPFPLAILFPDADGPGQRTAIYGDRLLENGWAVLEVVAGVSDSDPSDEPLLVALAAVAGDKRIHATRRVAIGLGSGARVLLAGWAAGAPIERVALLYPGCDADLLNLVREARPGPPDSRLLLLHGDADPANPPSHCANLAAAMPPGARALHRVLAGASYAWDGYSLVRPGGMARLPHPAGTGLRMSIRPDPTTTLIAADHLLGFALAAD